MVQEGSYIYCWQQLTQPFPLEQEFEITEVLDIGDYTYIIARQLQTTIPFEITATSKLGDIRLELYLEMPRSVDQEGHNREDVFIFCCSVLSPKPKKGSVVLLTNSQSELEEHL